MGLDLNVVVAPYWSYAYAGTRRSPIRSISVQFGGTLPSQDLTVYPKVRFESPFDEPIAHEWTGESRTLKIQGSHMGQPVEWGDIRLKLNYPLLGRIEEKAPTNVVIELVEEHTGNVIATSSESLTVLGRQDWLWDSASRGDMLAAFVNPRSAAVRQILTMTREILGRETGDPSTQGYQSGPQRALEIAAAVYQAISALGINYSDPPSGFDGKMQRVRTPDEVVNDKAGTCLDTTILTASCFAEAGLEPVLFLVPGHAFAGFFTGKDDTGYTLPDRLPGHTLSRHEHTGALSVLLEQRFVQPIETTTVCAGPSRSSFLEALSEQNNFKHGDVSSVEAMVVVSTAWKSGITPPIRLAQTSLHTEADDTAQSDFERRLGTRSAEGDLPGTAAIGDVAAEVSGDESQFPPRVRQWMASLLDLSARNPLLRIKKNILDIEVPPEMLGKLDDRLFERNGRIPIISPAGLPQPWLDNGVSHDEFESWSLNSLQLVAPTYRAVNSFAREVKAATTQIRDVAESRGQAISDLDAALLARRSVLAHFDQMLDKSLKTVKQKAKETLLDTGTNCMFLALGSVTWTSESDGRGKATSTQWEAPLYLYPVILDGGRKTPYTIRLDPNGEATPNHCLREKLRREPYNIELPELINPATDESGLDFDRMFESIRARLDQAKLHNFAVVPRAYLGVFDYSTFRLWSDLHDSWKEMVERSDAARHLILTPNQPFPATEATDSPALEPYLPIDADDSQEQAIRWALEGKSFRLEGPPGTGKTQTITNLLASCLAHGKKILFVAEKQTALDQVKKRMAAIGLANYCLDLHAQGDSDTRIRNNIQTALNAALAAQADARDADWNEVAFRVAREIEVLDRYRDALHDLGPAELSAWGAHERLLDFPDLDPVALPAGFLAEFSSRWPEVRRVLFEIRDLSSQAGTVATNSWSFIDPGGNADASDDSVRQLLTVIVDRTADLAKLQDVPQEIRGLSNPISLALIAEMWGLSATWGPLTDTVLSGAATTSTWSETATRTGALAETLLSTLKDNPIGAEALLGPDLAILTALRAEVANAGLLSRKRKIRALRDAIALDSGVSDDAMLSAVDQLLAGRQAADELQTALESELGLPSSVSDTLFRGGGNLNDLVDALRRLSNLVASDTSHRSSLDAFSRASVTMSPMTSQVIVSVGRAWADFVAVLPVSTERFVRRFGTRGLVETTQEGVKGLLDSASATGRFLDLERWIRLMASAAELERLGFLGHREEIADGTLDIEALAARIQFSVVKQALTERVQSGNLDRFDRKTHDARVRALEAALTESREILFDRIAGLIKSRSARRVLPSGRLGGETQDLIRGLKPTRGEKVPIRDLITKFGESLADAMPCFMMSPDSVAALVPVGAIDFDVVIFDEASQVRTSHAIGALGRGRAGIVVGDSKQMPPSSSFSSNQGVYIVDDDEDTGDEAEADAEDSLSALIGEAARDAESILTEFEESAFPALQLKCHYRSRDELLIAFSNSHVYDEPMLTFPSTAGLASDALSLRVVPDGRFERDTRKSLAWVGSNTKESIKTLRTNVAEARAVVTEVLTRLRDPERRRRRSAKPGTSAESIIVVTFNRPQMVLVDAMLRDADADLYAAATAEWTDEETGVKHDPQLKVRNLENVQGDEAETVIFSVAFSAREDGYFPLNFGPITQQGGIRRLNVAVTRAQLEMIVFASFRPDEMGDLSSRSEGAQMLQRFLRLAESGAQTTGSIGVGVQRSTHLREIARALEDLGFETQVQLGLSQMRVDIAVKRPGAARWELAILADDPNWASRGSSYQREILPMRVLKGLGWRDVARVWLPAWIEERDAVLGDLRDRLNALDSPAHEDEPETTEDRSVDASDQASTTTPEHPPTRQSVVDTPPAPAPESLAPTGPGITPFDPYVVRAVGTVTILDQAANNASARSVVRELIAKVVAAEFPVEHRRLAKTVANCLGLSRVTEVRLKQILQLVDPSTVLTDPIGTFVFPIGSEVGAVLGFRFSQDEASRLPEEISAVEYGNALVWLLEAARSLSVEDTMRELGGLFGFKRMTKNVTQTLSRAAESAVEAGLIARDDDRFRLPD